ncbi:MAG: pimeloyl-ACP methyl ester carboxylesterase [Bradymonadia bacterium]
MEKTQHLISNGDGWLLHLEQAWSADMRPDAKPIVIIPGYGMNAFIFSFHPRGTTLQRSLVEAGFEVWSLNLRRQGRSRPAGSRAAPGPSLTSYAAVDLTACVDAIVDRTRTNQGTVHLLGCSLGGTIAYAHMALAAEPKIASVACVGSPLRWGTLHPMLRAAFYSPRLIGKIKMKGSRRLARVVLPLISRAPKLLSPYMNADNVDIAAAGELVKTIEDPDSALNVEIAHWVNNKDLVLNGTNVTEALALVEIPLLLVLANRDGIVPTDAAESARCAWGGRVDTLNVGDDRQWYSHADLFVGNDAPEHVFKPLARWFRGDGLH